MSNILSQWKDRGRAAHRSVGDLSSAGHRKDLQVSPGGEGSGDGAHCSPTSCSILLPSPSKITWLIKGPIKRTLVVYNHFHLASGNTSIKCVSGNCWGQGARFMLARAEDIGATDRRGRRWFMVFNACADIEDRDKIYFMPRPSQNTDTQSLQAR